MKHTLKKAIVLAAMPAMAILTLIGCAESGTGGPNDSSSVSGLASETAAELSKEEQTIRDYEIRQEAGEFAEADYKALAELYAQQGLIRKQRDLLEQGWRLLGDKESFETLQTITVNVAEENALIQKEAKRLYQNLELEDYADEGVGMLLNQGWLNTMMPKLTAGRRNYYLQSESDDILYIQVGYDEDGQTFSKVWLTGKENDELSWVYQRGDMVQLLKTTLKDGQYTGAFDSWLCLASTGDVYHETGSFAKNVYVGDYTAQVHFGAEAADIFTLWGSRANLELTAYAGGFGTDGITVVEQPEMPQTEEGSEGGFVAYAYDAEKTNYLSLQTGTVDAASLVFNTELMGISAYPDFTPYEVKKDPTEQVDAAQIDAAQVQVRVYDGSLQWFDGTKWYTVGTVQEYMQADPFYGKEQPTAPDAAAGEDGKTAQSPAYQRRDGGSVAPVPEETPPVPEYEEPTPETPPDNFYNDYVPEDNGNDYSGGGGGGWTDDNTGGGSDNSSDDGGGTTDDPSFTEGTDGQDIFSDDVL